MRPTLYAPPAIAILLVFAIACRWPTVQVSMSTSRLATIPEGASVMLLPIEGTKSERYAGFLPARLRFTSLTVMPAASHDHPKACICKAKGERERGGYPYVMCSTTTAQKTSSLSHFLHHYALYLYYKRLGPTVVLALCVSNSLLCVFREKAPTNKLNIKAPSNNNYYIPVVVREGQRQQ